MENLSDQRVQIAIIGVAISVVLLIVIIFRSNSTKIALHPEDWRKFQLVDKKSLSHDVRRFRFALQSPDHSLGLPIGQHVSMQYYDDENKQVFRSYTPTSTNADRGFVDFCVKVYPPLMPKFPLGGKMSQHLDQLKIGDTMDMRGPKVCKVSMCVYAKLRV